MGRVENSKFDNIIPSWNQLFVYISELKIVKIVQFKSISILKFFERNTLILMREKNISVFELFIEEFLFSFLAHCAHFFNQLRLI